MNVKCSKKYTFFLSINRCEELNLLIRNFVKNSLDTIEMETEKKKQYSHFLRKFISVHCYNKVIYLFYLLSYE